MKVKNHQKIIWKVTANVWDGTIIDITEEVIDKSLFCGNITDGKGNIQISIYPKQSEWEECEGDKRKICHLIKELYERDLYHAVFSNNLRYPY